MAAINRVINVGFSSVNGAVPLLFITAAANVRLKVDKIGIYPRGTSTTDPPVLVEWCRVQTPGGGNAQTPVAVDPGVTETAQFTVTAAAPTPVTFGGTVTPVVTARRHPQGFLEIFRPTDDPLLIKGGETHGLRVTTGAAVDIQVCIEVEE